MLGTLLGPENTEINIEIVPVLRSFQESGRSRHKRLHIKGTGRVEAIPWVLGRHWAPWACCVGSGGVSRRFTEVCVRRLCLGGHFSSGKTGERVQRHRCSGRATESHSWCGVSVGELGLSCVCRFRQQWRDRVHQTTLGSDPR